MRESSACASTLLNTLSIRPSTRAISSVLAFVSSANNPLNVSESSIAFPSITSRRALLEDTYEARAATSALTLASLDNTYASCFI